MASGKVHDKSIKDTTLAVGVAALIVTGDPIMGITVAGSHLLGGLFLSPDLDIYSLPFKRWGFLKFYWLPYQRAVPHRSFISHTPVIGSLLRLLYLAFPILILLILLQVDLVSLLGGNMFYLACIWFGAETSALVHLWLDYK